MPSLHRSFIAHLQMGSCSDNSLWQSSSVLSRQKRGLVPLKPVSGDRHADQAICYDDGPGQEIAGRHQGMAAGNLMSDVEPRGSAVPVTEEATCPAPGHWRSEGVWLESRPPSQPRGPTWKDWEGWRQPECVSVGMLWACFHNATRS